MGCRSAGTAETLELLLLFLSEVGPLLDHPHAPRRRDFNAVALPRPPANEFGDGMGWLDLGRPWTDVECLTDQIDYRSTCT